VQLSHWDNLHNQTLSQGIDKFHRDMEHNHLRKYFQPLGCEFQVDTICMKFDPPRHYNCSAYMEDNYIRFVSLYMFQQDNNNNHQIRLDSSHQFHHDRNHTNYTFYNSYGYT
jgi:hypothetical protein